MNASIEYFSGLNSSVTSALVILLIILVVIVAGLFLYRRYLIRRMHKKEYWLPIINDHGNVIGRVARSVSFEEPGMYQHPLIRILVFKSGTIYLAPRNFEFGSDKYKYDHPFEYMMRYGYSVEESIGRIQKRFFPNSEPPKFLLRYKHENASGRWQILLYVLRIEDEKELSHLDKIKGKFWTIPQIDENLGKSFFSAELEGEIKFLDTLFKD